MHDWHGAHGEKNTVSVQWRKKGIQTFMHELHAWAQLQLVWICCLPHAVTTLGGAADRMARRNCSATSAFLPSGLDMLLLCMPLLCSSTSSQLECSVDFALANPEQVQQPTFRSYEQVQAGDTRCGAKHATHRHQGDGRPVHK